MNKTFTISLFLCVIIVSFSCQRSLVQSQGSGGKTIVAEDTPFDGEDYSEDILGVSIEMVAVEGGVFYMGSTDVDAAGDETPSHKVRLDDYYIGRYEITQNEWVAIIGDNPSYHKDCEECPVEDIQFRVQEFIDAINIVTGEHYRLPTEAEWEYAARGGVSSKSFKYSGSDNVDNVGWYTDNSDGTTQNVGELVSNELGIFDMTGNVWEPCSDKYHADFYNFTVPNNPNNPAMGNYHVLRGGSWFNSSYDCRSTRRIEGFRNYGSNTRGIRLAHDM
jgi:formylglycine-generating enzyme required for sulfatase activity